MHKIIIDKTINYKLLVSHPGETMKSIREGGYYYFHLEYYYCTMHQISQTNSPKPYESIKIFTGLVLFKCFWH